MVYFGVVPTLVGSHNPITPYVCVCLCVCVSACLNNECIVCVAQGLGLKHREWMFDSRGENRKLKSATHKPIPQTVLAENKFSVFGAKGDRRRDRKSKVGFQNCLRDRKTFVQTGYRKRTPSPLTNKHFVSRVNHSVAASRCWPRLSELQI